MSTILFVFIQHQTIIFVYALSHKSYCNFVSSVTLFFLCLYNIKLLFVYALSHKILLYICMQCPQFLCVFIQHQITLFVYAMSHLSCCIFVCSVHYSFFVYTASNYFFFLCIVTLILLYICMQSPLFFLHLYSIKLLF